MKHFAILMVLALVAPFAFSADAEVPAPSNFENTTPIGYLYMPVDREAALTVEKDLPSMAYRADFANLPEKTAVASWGEPVVVYQEAGVPHVLLQVSGGEFPEGTEMYLAGIYGWPETSDYVMFPKAVVKDGKVDFTVVDQKGKPFNRASKFAAFKLR